MAVFIAVAGERGYCVVWAKGARHDLYLSGCMEGACILMYSVYSRVAFPPLVVITVGGVYHFPK